MNVQEMKKIITNFFKHENVITSELGEIFIKEKIGEGGNALVYKAEYGRGPRQRSLESDCPWYAGYADGSP